MRLWWEMLCPIRMMNLNRNSMSQNQQMPRYFPTRLTNSMQTPSHSKSRNFAQACSAWVNLSPMSSALRMHSGYLKRLAAQGYGFRR